MFDEHCHYCKVKMKPKAIVDSLDEDTVWLVKNYGLRFTGRRWHYVCLFREYGYR